MLLEILKLLVTLLGGGLAGALLNERYRKRSSRVQPIPLIERVNRIVNPELKGITLARTVLNSGQRQLEELKNLREYQLTLRNSSTVRLQDAEIQFEFPAEDVEAWAERPTLSKTALIGIEASPAEPWKKCFRWRIPHLPSGDSVEFTFRAVDPPSDKYEVALYKSGGVVLERLVGEPRPDKQPSVFSHAKSIVDFGILILIVPVVMVVFTAYQAFTGRERVATVQSAGCDLQLRASFDSEGIFGSPWRIKYRILNVGVQDCILESQQIDPTGSLTIKAGEVLERVRIMVDQPKMTTADVSVGKMNSSRQKITVSVLGHP